MTVHKAQPVSADELISTGAVAELCSVARDTVLKWIRSGRIPAERTPGGHHRISLAAIQPLIRGRAIDNTFTPGRPGRIPYCWEFHGTADGPQKGCHTCVVYRSKALRCYELANLTDSAAHARRFCENAPCTECSYYRMVVSTHPSALLYTQDQRLRDRLAKQAKMVGMNLIVAESEYHCAICMMESQPHYAIIDCSLGVKRSEELAGLIRRDRHGRSTRVILLGKRNELPGQTGEHIFALVERRRAGSILPDIIGDFGGVRGRRATSPVNQATT